MIETNTDERRALKFLREHQLVDETEFRVWCSRRVKGGHETPLQISELWLVREVKTCLDQDNIE